MLADKELEKAVNRIMSRLDGVNSLYISKVATQIKHIGELNQTSVNRLLLMADMGADVAEINQQLQTATNMNVKDLFSMYQKALTDVYTDKRFSFFMTENPLPQSSKDRLTHYAQAVAVQSAKTMLNISNTTAVSTAYQEAVDKAVFAVSTGLTDYQSATREIVRSLGYNGMQVQYESGYHRRLDTAVRQNIIDATNQIAQNASIMMGDALGYDAIELSAHARSAPDHEPVQGRVFLKAEFEKMQSGADFVDIDGNHYSGFLRPIGEWNCMHIAMGFSTEHSVRRVTDDQLAAWKSANDKGCEIDGKHYSTYQAGQYMRQIETEIRRQKDVAVAAQKAGDAALRQQSQRKINALSAKYSRVAQASGITPRRDRMTVEGFKAVKV